MTKFFVLFNLILKGLKGGGKMIIFVFLIAFLISFNVYAFDSNWISKGLVVVYSAEGGSSSQVNPQEASAVYGRGYKIYTVFMKEGNEVYGLEQLMLFSQTSGSVFYQSTVNEFNIQKTGTSFYLNPDQLEKEIKSKSTLPRNCKLFGKAGNISLVCNQNGIESKIVLVYDTKTGLIKESIGSQKSNVQGNLSQMRLSYLTHFYIDIPDVKNFPEAALNSYTYRIISSSPMGVFPTGSLSIKYKNKINKVAFYSMDYQGFPIDMIGIPYVGPHYLHPALLRKKSLLEVPQIGFKMELSPEDGKVILNHIWNGNIILQQEYDKKTGLKLKEVQPMGMGINIILELK